MNNDKSFLIITPDTSILWPANEPQYRLDIHDDPNPENPREMDDTGTTGHMICWHKRYNLGDRHDYASPSDFVYCLAKSFNCIPEVADEDDYNTQEMLVALKPYIVILPLWLYDHSGISMTCGTDISYPYTDCWDAGQVGYIYITKDEMKNIQIANETDFEANWTEWATELLKNAVSTYSSYIENDVYGYTLFQRKNDIWEEQDSVYGFYGSDLMQNGMVDYLPSDFVDCLNAGTYDIVPTNSIPANPPPPPQLVVATPLGELVAKPINDPINPGIHVNLRVPNYTDELGLGMIWYDQRGQNLKNRVFGEAMMEEATHEETYTNIKKFFQQKGPIGDEAPVVYICAPYAGTDEERARNVENAKRYGLFAINQGYVPYIAHLAICSFLEDNVPEEREIGIQADNIMIRRCDEIWVFGDRITPGMKAEIQLCHELQKPVKYFDIRGEVPALMAVE